MSEAAIEDGVVISKAAIREQAVGFIEIGEKMLASIGEKPVRFGRDGSDDLHSTEVRREVRRLVQDLRDAFGCGQIDFDGISDGETSLSDYVTYVRDTVRAIEDLDGTPFIDLRDAIQRVRDEAAYLDKADPNVFKPEISGEAARNIAWMKNTFAALEDLGFITAP